MSAKYGVQWLGRYEGFLAALCNGVRDDDDESCSMMARFFDIMLPEKAVVIPMPSHDGRARQMLKVSRYLKKRRRDIKVADILTCDPHESSRDAKKRGCMPPPMTMRAEPSSEKERGGLFDGRKIFILDNCVVTGATATAALEAIPGAIVLALARDMPHSHNRR